jgi:hypothetical protein
MSHRIVNLPRHCYELRSNPGFNLFFFQSEGGNAAINDVPAVAIPCHEGSQND